MQEQSRRHGYLLHLIGVRQLAVVVNKMDAAGYSRTRFEAVAKEARTYLRKLGLTASCIIPASAREGENITARPERMPWHEGPSIAGALDAFREAPDLQNRPLRLPVQDVYKFDARRVIAGRVEAGRFSRGDALLFSPSNKTARVRTIEVWPSAAAPPETAQAGQSVGITLDEQIFIERGEIASHADAPPVESDVFRAHIFWLSHQALRAGDSLKMKLGTMETPVAVQSIERVIDTGGLRPRPAEAVQRNQVAEVVLRARRLLALNPFAACAATGRFVLVAGYDIAGGGIISMEGYADQRPARSAPAANLTRVEHRVSAGQRTRRAGPPRRASSGSPACRGPGNQPSPLALEQKLFERGLSAYVLDGDNVRHGLNADLGFSPEDRRENIRRIGEVAALFERAGMIAVAAFISPYRFRPRPRPAPPAPISTKIYIDADLATCEARDPKGLYRKARAGELREFTGLSAPYEAPEAPELVLDTRRSAPESKRRAIARLRPPAFSAFLTALRNKGIEFVMSAGESFNNLSG